MKGWKAPKCSSRKIAYRTQGRALHALRIIAMEEAQAVAHRDGHPCAAYRCRECGAWHLTSSPGGTSVMEGAA